MVYDLTNCLCMSALLLYIQWHGDFCGYCNVAGNPTCEFGKVMVMIGSEAEFSSS